MCIGAVTDPHCTFAILATGDTAVGEEGGRGIGWREM